MDNLLTPQPPPQNKGHIVYDKLADWLEKEPQTSTALRKLCYERYLQGIEKYGQPLMSDDGRNTESDVIQELIDCLMYTMKGIMQGKDWGYHFFEVARVIDDFLEELENV